MRPQLRQVIQDNRQQWLRDYRIVMGYAQVRELWYGPNDEQAKGYRLAAKRFEDRILGNPTPELPCQEA